MSIFLAAAGATDAPHPPSWFWGCWVVTKSLPTSGVSGLSQKETEAMIGTRIVFTRTCARSGRTVIHSPKYSVKVLSAREFFDLGYFPLNQIGIHDQQVDEVQVVLPDNLSDFDFTGSQTFLRKPDIVVNIENHSFLAEKAKPGDAGCTCDTPQAK